MGSQHHVPAVLPRERTSTHCIGGWVGLEARLDGMENLTPPEIDRQTVQPVGSRWRPTDKSWRKAWNCRQKQRCYDAVRAPTEVTVTKRNTLHDSMHITRPRCADGLQMDHGAQYFPRINTRYFEFIRMGTRFKMNCNSGCQPCRGEIFPATRKPMIQLWDMKLRHSVIVSQRFEVGIAEYEGTMFLRNVGNRFLGDAESAISQKNGTQNPTAVKPFKNRFGKCYWDLYVVITIAIPRNTQLHSTDMAGSPETLCIWSSWKLLMLYVLKFTNLSKHVHLHSILLPTLCTYLIKNYHNSHLKPHTLKMSVMH